LAGDYQEAISYGLSALSLAEELDLQVDVAKASKYIGISYYRLKDFDKAIEFHNKALDIYIVLKELIYEADCYTNIGVVYDESAEFDKALEYYNKALVIYEKENELSGMADIYNNIAGIYYQKHENDKIIDYMNKSLDIKRQMDDKIGISYTLINIGGVYAQIGNSEKGVESIKEGIDIAVNIDLLPLVNVGYEALFEVYKNNNDYKTAFEYYELYNQTKDSLFDIEKTKSIQELQTKYETEKKNVEIKELKIQQIKDDNLQKLFLVIIGSLLIVAVLLVIFFMQRTRMNSILNEKNNELQNLNATQNRLMSIISHDLKAPLSAFYSITSSLKSKFDNISRQDIDHYFNRMLNSSVALKMQLENMLNWAINQSSKISVKKGNFNLYILNLKVVMILQEFANEKNITITNNIDENSEIKTDSKLFSIVLNNLISNAIKFSNPDSEIIISAMKKNEKIIFSIKDSGVGMTKDELENLFTDKENNSQNENRGTGLGLIVSKDIIEKLGCRIWAESEENVGTEFFIEI
jgi:signal transduction histidine kinase